jgi:hypothetical protein
MPYAVLQTDLNPPSFELLRRVFPLVPGLTAGDAAILGKDAFGVLVKNFSEEQASALQGALRREGIETEIVDQSFLPELPPTKFVSRVDYLPEHLLIYDPLGRSFPLPWPHLMFIAAGNVKLSEFVREREATEVLRYGGDGHAYTDIEYETRHREERNFRFIAELVVTGAVLRYSIAAEKFNFISLGERRTSSAAQNFALFLGEIIRSPRTRR